MQDWALSAVDTEEKLSTSGEFNLKSAGGALGTFLIWRISRLGMKLLKLTLLLNPEGNLIAFQQSD